MRIHIRQFDALRYMSIENTFKYYLQNLDKVPCNKNHYWFKFQFAATLKLWMHRKLSQVFKFRNF